LTVNSTLNAVVSIASNQTSVCSGSSVSLTATGVNGGTSPTVQWYKNGIPQATGSVYSYAPSNSDAIVAIYTAGGNGTACIIGSPATSNGISLTVNSTLNAAVSIASNQTSVCSGSSVSLTATGVNGGSSPTVQWFKNGIPQATGLVYSYIPANGDAIVATYTAGGNGTSCIVGSPANSNSINLTVNNSFTPSITIAASQLAGCTGTSVTFTATGVNGGNAPLYQWQINGVNQGSATTSNLFSAVNTTSNNLISATLVSNASCANPSQALSNTITLTSIPNGTSPCLAPSTGSISGLNSVVADQSNVTYTVENIAGTSYNWSVPNGATIASGQGTNSITVTFGTKGGNVGLTTSNNYGTTNTTLVVNLVVTGIENTKTPFDIVLYPNPFTNSINVTIESAVSQPFQINIFDTKGVEVEQKSGLSVGTYSIGESLSSGVYTAKITNGSDIKLLKLVKIN
jgi:predicted transcriptional regulator